MKKQKNQLFSTTFICLAILLMGIYFASVSYSAAVNGTKNINTTPAKWDVNIDELSYSETIGSMKADKHSISATTSSSEVTLNNPGDFYEYTVKIDNDGSMDSILRGINIEGIKDYQKDYLNYSVTYNEEKYTERTRDLDVPLQAGQSLNAIIRVEYKEIDQAVLPVVPQTFNLVTTFEFQQA